MTVEIPPEYQNIVSRAIGSGNYKSESEVVGDALRLLEQRRQSIEELRREIQPALDRLDRGEGIELHNEEELESFFEDIKSRGRASLADERESP